MRRTRRYVIDGQVVVTTQKRVVTADGKKDLAFEKLQKRKDAMREVTKFMRKEKILIERAGTEIEQKQAEFETKTVNEEVALSRQFEIERDRICKNFKNSMSRLEQNNEKDFQAEQTKFKQEKEQSLKKFKSRQKDSNKNTIKIEESRLARDVESSDRRKECLKAFKINLENESAEKVRQFTQSLEQKYVERMKELKRNQIEESFNQEMLFLSEKQSLAQNWNKKINDLKEYSIQQNAQLTKQSNRERFDLVRKLNLERYDRQLIEMNSQHEKEIEELKARHMTDRKLLPKELEKENKQRLLMHRSQIEIMLEKKVITEAESKQRTIDFKKNDVRRKEVLVKKREEKRKEELDIMKERHDNEMMELMSFQNEQKARLDDTEKKKETQAELEFKKELEKFREERRERERKMEDDFLKEVEVLKSNYDFDNNNLDRVMKVGFEPGGSGSWSPTSGTSRTFSMSSGNVPKSPLKQLHNMGASLELSGESGDTNHLQRSVSNSDGFS